jgi:hypothetical protein
MPNLSAPTKADIARLLADGPRAFCLRYIKTLRQTRTGSEAAPFPDFPYFAESFEAFERRLNVIGRKSRQMTVSWFGAATRLYNCLWYNDWASFMMSRKEGLVDDGGGASTPQSLFGKIRYCYEHLPEWMQRANPLHIGYLKIGNPRTGSAIMGESTTVRSGAGGAVQDAWFDEFAWMPRQGAIVAANRQACPAGAWYISTPSGKGNAFHRLWNSPTSDFVKLQWPWWEHPERKCTCTDPLDLDPEKHHGCWYARACEGLTPAQIGSELNMSFEESVEGRVYYQWSDRFVGDVPYQSPYPIIRTWDLGVGDDTAILFLYVVVLHSMTGRAFKALRVFDAYRKKGMGANHYREVLQTKAEKYRNVDVSDIGDPHSLENRESDLSSWQANLQDHTHPYKVFIRSPNCRALRKENLIENSRKFLAYIECQDGVRRPRVLIDRKLTWVIEAFEGYAYHTDDDGNIVSREPVHNAYSHPMDAWQYACFDIDPPSGAMDPGQVSGFESSGPTVADILGDTSLW